MDRTKFGRTALVGLSVAVFSALTAEAIQRDRGDRAVEAEVVTAMASGIADDVASSVAAEAETTERWVETPDWDLPVERNERVDYFIDFLSGRNYDKTRLWLERLGRYGPMLQQELRERGMPEDLVYLAMIESGFSPNAYSHAHAAGIWQFIAPTGRRYGLEVSTYVDERRDPIAATEAALDYLEDLYDRFGSWYLAAAGYNTGENRVGRILRQRIGTERASDEMYWRISSRLPRETRDYVPVMLAAGHIGKDPEAFGFDGLEYQEPLRFAEVEVPGGVRLEVVAEAAGVSADAVRDLNPHLVRGMTPPGRTWMVRVPTEVDGSQFAANFERAVEDARASMVEHRVRSGETLTHIARRYGVSVGTLRAANAGLNPHRIQVGQRIQVPGADAVVAVADEPEWQVHRVRRGDTLWGIARRYGVSVGQIRVWNEMAGSRIQPGQRIRVRA